MDAIAVLPPNQPRVELLKSFPQGCSGVVPTVFAAERQPALPACALAAALMLSRGRPVRRIRHLSCSGVQDDDWYFQAYSQVATQREMLEDGKRMKKFRRAISETCAGKVVMDLGCGSGILSLFAAQAGAAQVVAVEGSQQMAALAREAVQRNGFSETVTVVSGRVEDPSVQAEVDAVVKAATGGKAKVDVLLSEWMGFMLVCEDMFQSVALARNLWLKPGGEMLPVRCQVWAAPFDGGDIVEDLSWFWEEKVEGMDMSHMLEPALNEAFSVPVMEELGKSSLLAPPCKLYDLDCTAAPPDEPGKQRCDWSFMVKRAKPLHGLAIWFTCDITENVGFSTGPGLRSTHWQQTLVFAQHAGAEGVPCSKGDRLFGELFWETYGKGLRIKLHGTCKPADDQRPPLQLGADIDWDSPARQS